MTLVDVNQMALSSDISRANDEKLRGYASLIFLAPVEDKNP
ncbi:MAG TPA: hypothetical protein VEL11_02470 [Candidatus Bathyarchaeia archaeon]|nr:hypothetical protein [Candidatus Bathyarchaeia archaeon]